jgi:hypothetical protein
VLKKSDVKCLGTEGVTLSCIHASSFREKKMETNLDMLHPDANLFPFGTRVCITAYCVHIFHELNQYAGQ